MTKVVVDTNVLASGLTGFSNPSSIVAHILRLWRAGGFELVTSAHILTELAHTLQRPYFRQRLTPEQISSAITLLKSESTITPITTKIKGIATHPEDDVILATAVSAKADYLVTGDTELQHLGTYRGMRILSPRRFLATPEHEVAEERIE
jgi:putative PIN family toxin of toxin-antitoxin system